MASTMHSFYGRLNNYGDWRDCKFRGFSHARFNYQKQMDKYRRIISIDIEELYVLKRHKYRCFRKNIGVLQYTFWRK